VKPLPHHYTVRLTGESSGHAILAADGLPELPTAPPREFDGPGDAWSPEHLLLAAVQACFLFTLRGAALASGAEFLGCEVDAEGTVDRVDRVTRFTEIVLRARLRLRRGVDRARARRVAEKAERACLVSASLATPVRLELELLESDSMALAAEIPGAFEHSSVAHHAPHGAAASTSAAARADLRPDHAPRRPSGSLPEPQDSHDAHAE
jgi:organic hydroperoxide reductase OsmC/OhrA